MSSTEKKKTRSKHLNEAIEQCAFFYVLDTYGSFCAGGLQSEYMRTAHGDPANILLVRIAHGKEAGWSLYWGLGGEGDATGNPSVVWHQIDGTGKPTGRMWPIGTSAHRIRADLAHEKEETNDHAKI